MRCCDSGGRRGICRGSVRCPDGRCRCTLVGVVRPCGWRGSWQRCRLRCRRQSGRCHCRCRCRRGLRDRRTRMQFDQGWRRHWRTGFWKAWSGTNGAWRNQCGGRLCNRGLRLDQLCEHLHRHYQRDGGCTQPGNQGPHRRQVQRECGDKRTRMATDALPRANAGIGRQAGCLRMCGWQGTSNATGCIVCSENPDRGDGRHAIESPRKPCLCENWQRHARQSVRRPATGSRRSKSRLASASRAHPASAMAISSSSRSRRSTWATPTAPALASP
jgi:hypothetical protein